MLPRFLKPVSNWFRARRNARLVAQIDRIHGEIGRPVTVLDAGGSYIFWGSIANRRLCRVTLVNLEEAYADLDPLQEQDRDLYTNVVGDVRDLSRFADQSFDLVVCNSVLEHVGLWMDMRRAASELQRVGRHGWVQVPAFGFPLEQHFLVPFAHWLPEPLTTALVWLCRRSVRSWGWEGLRINVALTKPLTRYELRKLFPHFKPWTERLLLLPKSHVVEW